MFPVEVEYAPPPLAGCDEDAAQAATLLEQRLRAKPEQAEEKRARGPQDADARCADASDQNPCGHGCAPEGERPGHLAPLKEVGHLQSPLPDPRRQTAASRLDRATSVESRGDGVGPRGIGCRWLRRRNDGLVRDHLAVGDLRRIGRPSTRRPRRALHPPRVVAPEPLELQQVPDAGFTGLVAEPVDPFGVDSLVAADGRVHRVLLAVRSGRDPKRAPCCAGPIGTAEEEC